ncbi:hypothetical protein [Natrialba aegyptia]|uniref:hypothetical protein n=1 Tax=Natrialba aegyptia TaxID=129789 RepID=UPI000677AA19|nr:hypothetical protein [Natrialba aegyptia]
MPSPRTIALALTVLAASGGIISLTGAVTAVESSSNATIPADGPAYGVNETRYPLLWSEDVDHGNHSSNGTEDTVSSGLEFSTRLANSTDVPFDEPITDVETWNSGDLQDFAPGEANTSVYPDGTHRENGLYIKDAYTSIVAVQPSTILHTENNSTRYIAPDGEVLTIADYRVALPDNDDSGSTRDQWSIARSSIDSVTLQADGRELDTDGDHRSTLEYSGLAGTQNLTVETNISVRLRHKTQTCWLYNSTADSCDGSWKNETEYLTDQVTVTDSYQAVATQINERGGKRVTFENAENHTGVVIHPGTTWAGLDISSDVCLRGNWRFYSAGIDGWRTMVSRNETTTTQRNSSVRPAQLHAVPMQQEPVLVSEATGDVEIPLVIEEAWGREQNGTSLPDTISIPVADRYVNATSIAVRSETLPAATFDEVTVRGIVRGQSQTISVTDNGAVSDTNLNLTVLEADSSGALVQAIVTENTTGDPVTTGRVEVGNQSAAVNASGIAVLELEERPSLVVDGQYVPRDWWRAEQLYSSASDRAKIPANYPEFQKLVEFVLVTLLWFLPAALAVYGFDYVTGGAALGLRDQQ